MIREVSRQWRIENGKGTFNEIEIELEAELELETECLCEEARRGNLMKLILCFNQKITTPKKARNDRIKMEIEVENELETRSKKPNYAIRHKPTTKVHHSRKCR